MRGLDQRLARAAMWLGAAGVLAASFALASGPWKPADIKGPPVIVTIVLGLLAIAGARLAMRLLVLLSAVGYLATAFLQLAQFGRPTNWLGGSGSTFALFLGLGLGLLAVALAPALEPDTLAPDKGDPVNLAQRLQPVLDVVRDNAEHVDMAAEFPKEGVESLRASGLLGLTLPTEVGGLGGGPVELVETLSALASECGSTAMVYLMHISAAMAVAKSPPPGDPELLHDLASGRRLATLALSEKGSRSHFWAPVSRCTQERDQLRVRASKSFVTSAGHADLYLASTLSPTGGPTETSFIAIPAGTPGLDVVGAFTGLGLRGNASAPMTIDSTLAESYRLPAAGFALTFEVILPWFSIGNAAVSLGLAQGALDLAIGHVSQARLEHEGSTLAELPTVRARVARAGVAVAVHRAYIAATARSIAAPDETTMGHVLGVKATANEMALLVTDEAMRVCGGAAFARSLPVERYFRDARAGAVMAPTSDVLFDFYGKVVTGLPLF